jgi:cellulose biosynthesis protein BcsE
MPITTPLRWLSWLLPQWTGAQPNHHNARGFTLPIAFLPEGLAELPPRHTGVLLFSDEATRQRTLRSLLEQALAEGPVTWLGAGEHELPALGPDVAAAGRRGRLRALAWTADAAEQMAQRGDAHLLDELADLGSRRHDPLIVSAFDPWLAGLGPDASIELALQRASTALQAWARGRRGAVLAIGPARHGEQALLPLLLHGSLPGLAQLQAHGEQMHLEIARWHGASGAQSDLAFGLVDRPDGGWQADGTGLALDAHQLLDAADADAVLTTADLVQGATGVPAHWQVHENIDALLAHSRFAVAATVLLPYNGAADIAPLAGAVRRLRRAHPHALKIVVRERAAKLRYNHELALLRLGANAVVYREIGFSRLVQTTVELRGQLYGRVDAGADVPGTLDAVAPDAVQGYLPVAGFCAAVERMLERTRPVALSHCLVQLPLLPQVAHLDALLACRINRDGDLVTADDEGLSLFLFACREPDVNATLERLFGVPASELFSLIRVAPEAESIGDALAALRRGAADAVADYSAILQASRPRPAERPAEGAPRPAAAAPVLRPLTPAHPAPRQLQPHALSLRR